MKIKKWVNKINEVNCSNLNNTNGMKNKTEIVKDKEFWMINRQNYIEWGRTELVQSSLACTGILSDVEIKYKSYKEEDYLRIYNENAGRKKAHTG